MLDKRRDYLENKLPKFSKKEMEIHSTINTIKIKFQKQIFSIQKFRAEKIQGILYQIFRTLITQLLQNLF